MEKITNLRNRRRSETRALLCHAALALAVKAGGVAAVSVDAIAERAGVSRRTLFNYFPVKEAAFAWPMTSLALRFVEEAEKRPRDDDLWEVLETSAVLALGDPQSDLALAAEADRMLSSWPPLLASAPTAEIENDLSALVARRLLAEVTRRCGDEPADAAYRQLVAGCASVALRVAVRACAERDDDPAPHVAKVFASLRAGLPPTHRG